MNLLKFKKGMTVYVIPIRYWEQEWPIKPLTVEHNCGMDNREIYARDKDEDQAMYYSVHNRVYYELESAEEARKLLTRLHDLENEDCASAWVDIIKSDVEESFG